MLVTNIAGTGHSGGGSIDKLQALLDEHIPIQSEAWWRDDLDRRLDNAWDLKFAYPQLFTGTDLLRLVFEASPSEDRERRLNAITSFLSGQFDADREVKFKQADLENDIFELFTDVPLIPRNPLGEESESDRATRGCIWSCSYVGIRRCGTILDPPVVRNRITGRENLPFWLLLA